MAKPKTPNQKHKYSELNKRLAKYVMLVESIYEDLNLEAAKIVGITDFTIDSDRPFMWSDYPQTRKRIRDLQERFVEDIGAVIYSGTSEEWKNSNEVQDLLANKVLQTYGATIGKKNYEILYQPNNDALEAFQQRKDKGFTISDKLWNQSILYKQELEEAISCAIQKGTSAITLSKQISKYLLDFPQLQKDYKERFGKASRSMDCEYRSIRLAASEINMAYRQAENLRWQQMDFVVGYEIKLSNNHTCNGKPFQDICDILAGKYPKDFQWTGWHPLCYSDDSEVLTNRGWKLFKDVLDDDLILSLNPESRNVEWVGISDRQCYKYEGEMIHFFNRSLDCLVTPEHQMVYLNKGDGRIEHQAAAAFDQSKGALFRGRTGVDVKYDIHLTFNKESVAYDGYVYDLTLAENHIMYIRRNGKCFWGSNCRCYKIPILKTEEEFWEWDGRSEVSTTSVNEVKDVPEAFKQWVGANAYRIEEAKKRGTLPYFVRDNQKRIGSILDYTPTSTFTVYKIAGIEQLSVLDGSNYDLTKAVSDVESNIRQNKSYETGVLFNKDGNIVIDKRGRSRSVQFTKDECLLMNDGIFTHNHPGAWGYAGNDIMRIGNSFSIQDIALAVGNNLAEMRAVTPNYTFSMKRPDGGWGISVEELMMLYNDENRNLRLEFTRRINKGTLTISQASATHFHILWKRLSKKLGFDYSKMKTK